MKKLPRRREFKRTVKLGNFTMELEENGKLPFLGLNVIRNGCRLDTTVYRKPTDTGLLLHYHSHVDARCKRSLLNTMLNRAFKLSSTWKFFYEECERLREIFSRLRYPDDLVQSTIRSVWRQHVISALLVSPTVNILTTAMSANSLYAEIFKILSSGPIFSLPRLLFYCVFSFGSPWILHWPLRIRSCYPD